MAELTDEYKLKMELEGWEEFMQQTQQGTYTVNQLGNALNEVHSLANINTSITWQGNKNNPPKLIDNPQPTPDNPDKEFSAIHGLNNLFAPKSQGNDLTESQQLLNNMTQLTRQIGSSNTIVGEVITGITSLIGVGIGVTSAITGIGALITALIAILKADNEWKNASLRAEAWGGSTQEAQRLANEFGIANWDANSDFMKAYTQANRYGVSYDQMVLAMRTGEFTDGSPVAGLNNVWRLASGDASAYTNISGGAMSNFGYNDIVKVYGQLGNVSAVLGQATAKINRDATMTVDEFARKSEEINSFARGIARTTNEMGSGMTTQSVIGKEIDDLGRTNSKPMNVAVVNSIMLEKSTIDELVDLREHQFMGQIQMQHTTPMFNIQTTVNNGDGHIQNAEQLGQEIMSLANSGATTSNIGGI